MAIRGVRTETEDTIDLDAGEVMSAGALVSFSLTVEGDAVLAPSGSTRVVGVLREEVVAVPAGPGDYMYGDVYTVATPLFQEKGTRYVGEKISIVRQGTIITDQLEASITPSGGALAYLGSSGSGLFDTASTTAIKVGVFQGVKDADGFVKIHVNIER